MLILRKMKKGNAGMVKKWEKNKKDERPRRRIPESPGQDPGEKEKDKPPKAWKEEKFE
jgi:hypothetical protein